MFTKIKALVFGAVSALFVATGAFAAPINFTVDSVTLTRTSNCADLFCNVATSGITSIIGVPRTADTAAPTPIQAFQYSSVLAPSFPRAELIGDTFNIQAVVVLKIASSTYSYIANGVMTNWRVGPFGNVLGGTLSWNSFINSATGPLKVVFGTELFGVQGRGSNAFSDIFVSAVPSVVPLSAGLVMLLTALLGLFGLKRRKALVA